MTDPAADPSAVDDQATRVVVSFPSPETEGGQNRRWWSPESDWLREELSDGAYQRYLRRAHAGPVSVGDEWDEAVNCGCASPIRVRLRVEHVEGGDAIGEDTGFEVVARAGDGEM